MEPLQHAIATYYCTGAGLNAGFDGSGGAVGPIVLVGLTLLVWATLRTIFDPPQKRPVAAGRSKACAKCRCDHPRFARFCRKCGTEL